MPDSPPACVPSTSAAASDASPAGCPLRSAPPAPSSVSTSTKTSSTKPSSKPPPPATRQNVTFLERSAYDTGLPSASFDIIFCRYLLCHLTDPLDVLAEMYRLLKPGGAVVCVDLDITAAYASPPSLAMARSIDIAMDTGKALGVTYAFGRKLHSAMLKTGFVSVTPRLDQPVYLSGPGKRMWEHTFHEAGDGIVALGVATQQEIDQICRQLCELAMDPETLIAQWTSILCRAVKP